MTFGATISTGALKILHPDTLIAKMK